LLVSHKNVGPSLHESHEPVEPKIAGPLLKMLSDYRSEFAKLEPVPPPKEASPLKNARL
jgi:hypothetical protein